MADQKDRNPQTNPGGQGDPGTKHGSGGQDGGMKQGQGGQTGRTGNKDKEIDRDRFGGTKGRESDRGGE